MQFFVQNDPGIRSGGWVYADCTDTWGARPNSTQGFSVQKKHMGPRRFHNLNSTCPDGPHSNNSKNNLHIASA